jgi:uncharacterized cupredoxin-like copper-binding protein
MLRNTAHRLVISLVIASLSLLALAGCAAVKPADASVNTAASAPKPIDVSMKEFSFNLNTTTAKTGEITFKIANAGNVVHEFVVEKTDLAPTKLPMKSDGTVDEEQLTSPGEQGDIAPGASTDLTLKLEPGTYMFICNLPGHFAGKMYSTFTVTN